MKRSHSHTSKWISSTAAAKLLEVSRQTVIQWAEKKILKKSFQPYPGAWWKHDRDEVMAMRQQKS